MKIRDRRVEKTRGRHWKVHLHPLFLAFLVLHT